MKLPNALKRLGNVLTIAATAVVLGLASNTASAADQVKGGQKLVELNQIKTAADAEALKPGDTIAMVCAKCKSVAVTHVGREKGHIKTVTVGEKHLCPGCKSTIEVVGHGKGKTDVVKHVCKACGDDSAFCCATKPGASATTGVEK